MAMDLDLESLPRYPTESQEKPRKKDEHLPTRGEALCTLFEFATGLALVNIVLMVFVAVFFTRDARDWTGAEAILLFSGFALLIVVSQFYPTLRANEDVYKHYEDTFVWPRLLVLGIFIGGGVGFGFAWNFWHLFGYLEALGHPMQSFFDNIVVGVLFGALVGIVGGAGVTLAGGTPDWKSLRLLTALGRIFPMLIRKVLFPAQRHQIKVPCKPWLEGFVWFCCVVGPIIWFIW